jgi:hypothetical protein
MAKDQVGVVCGHCANLVTLDLIHERDELPPRVRWRCKRGHSYTVTRDQLKAALEMLKGRREANPAIKARLVAGVDV